MSTRYIYNKIALLACVLVASLSLSASNSVDYFEFVDKDGNVVPDGTTLTLTEVTTEEDVFGEVTSTMYSHLNLRNTTGETRYLRINMLIERIDNGTYQLCFPMACKTYYDVTNIVTEGGKMAGNELKDLMTEWIPTDEGGCDVTLTVEVLNMTGSILNPTFTYVCDGPTVTLHYRNGIIDPINGDANADGVTDILDVDEVINIILGRTAELRTSGDANGDGIVDIFDVNEVVNVMLGRSIGPGTTTYTVGGVSFTMVAVQGGTFTMGATAEQGSDAESDEEPAHQVTLSSYSIGQTEVTQELWQAVMGSNPSYFTGNLQRPVERVSWNDCQTFISKLNQMTGKSFRLPTEAEWEYAARGGNRSQGYKYAGSNAIGDVAWYTDNSAWTTHTVATKAPNELGLYDMSGNVYEWCQDWYGSYSSGAQTNPTGPASGSTRVYRGGGRGNNAGHCRVSYRTRSAPSGANCDLGLRLAL